MRIKENIQTPLTRSSSAAAPFLNYSSGGLHFVNKAKLKQPRPFHFNSVFWR